MPAKKKWTPLRRFSPESLMNILIKSSPLVCFQARHRINTFAGGAVDCYGAVGTDTREQINVSVKTRIDQIRINLERARSVMHHLPASFLLADIASFSAVLVDDDQIIWCSRV